MKYAGALGIIGNANGRAEGVQDECRSVNPQCIVELDTGLGISTAVIVASALLSVLPLLFLVLFALEGNLRRTLTTLCNRILNYDSFNKITTLHTELSISAEN